MKPITLVACIAIGGSIAVYAGLYVYGKAREVSAEHEAADTQESYKRAMQRMVDGERVLSINCGETTFVDVSDGQPGFSEAGLDLIRGGCGDKATVTGIVIQTKNGDIVQKWP